MIEIFVYFVCLLFSVEPGIIGIKFSIDYLIVKCKGLLS